MSLKPKSPSIKPNPGGSSNPREARRTFSSRSADSALAVSDRPPTSSLISSGDLRTDSASLGACVDAYANTFETSPPAIRGFWKLEGTFFSALPSLARSNRSSPVRPGSPLRTSTSLRAFPLPNPPTTELTITAVPTSPSNNPRRLHAARERLHRLWPMPTRWVFSDRPSACDRTEVGAVPTVAPRPTPRLWFASLAGPGTHASSSPPPQVSSPPQDTCLACVLSLCPPGVGAPAPTLPTEPARSPNDPADPDEPLPDRNATAVPVSQPSSSSPLLISSHVSPGAIAPRPERAPESDERSVKYNYNVQTLLRPKETSRGFPSPWQVAPHHLPTPSCAWLCVNQAWPARRRFAFRRCVPPRVASRHAAPVTRCRLQLQDVTCRLFERTTHVAPFRGASHPIARSAHAPPAMKPIHGQS